MPGKNLTRAEAEQRAGLIEVVSYDITVDLTSQFDTFPVTTTIHFQANQPGASTFLDLIAPAVRQVTLNGQELAPVLVFADSRIQLDNLAADNTVTVVADAVYSHTGEGLHRLIDPVDGLRYIYTQFEVADARRLFASFEQPDLKARFTFHVLAPTGWTVLSNTVAPVPVTEDDHERWDFPQTPVMSTYLTAIVAGPYQGWYDTYTRPDGRTIPLGVYVRRSMAQYMDAPAIFDITKQGFEFYERSFGIDYPYDKYDQAFVPEYNAGAMENIGLITLAEAHYVFRSRPVEAQLATRANTILHEMAHMWFGDLVTMKWWNDLWLNESFAEFMSHFAAVGNTRWTNAWTDFLAVRKQTAYQQDQLPTTHPIVADIRDLADVEVNFDMITYAKGASVLKQLVAWVGQEAFLAGVHNYLTKHAWGNATLTDFLAEVSAASGRDLTEWSKVWLEESGVTTLRPLVTIDGGVFQSVIVTQEVPPIYQLFADVPHRDLPAIVVKPSLRPHHVEIAGYSMSADGLTRAWSQPTDIWGAATPIDPLAGQTVPDILVVNDADLTYAKLRLDPFSLMVVKSKIAEIDDELTRSLLWASLWDSLRGGELAPRDYVELVLKALDKETNSTALSSLLTRLRSTIQLYVSRDLADQVQDDAAARLIGLAMQVDPGSDQQIQLVRAFAGLSCNSTQWGFLAELLAGTAEVPGLVVDTDLRWEILSCLVAAGQMGETEIAAELARDDTSAGREFAAGARAAIPTLEAKRAAWRLAVHDNAISNTSQRTALTWFTQVQDAALLREFAIEYFAVIEDVWVNRSREMAGNIVRLGYPLVSVNDPTLDVLTMTDQWLDRLGAREPGLRRLVLARREEVVCAQIARARDAEKA